jgi:hypothetical protein
VASSSTTPVGRASEARRKEARSERRIFEEVRRHVSLRRGFGVLTGAKFRFFLRLGLVLLGADVLEQVAALAAEERVREVRPLRRRRERAALALLTPPIAPSHLIEAQLAESVEVELPHEALEVVVAEVLAQDRREAVLVAHTEGIPRVVPPRDLYYSFLNQTKWRGVGPRVSRGQGYGLRGRVDLG